MNVDKIEKIENNFTYHEPKGDQNNRYEKLRENAKQLSYLIENLCPESKEKEIAILKLKECIMWANASIAINE